MQWAHKGWKKRWLWVLFLAALCPLLMAQKIGDPYEILGISRRATLVEIRKAYRQKAKEWHPDKNLHPNAESRFVEIKQAYELLSDTERRQAYDLYGITNEDEHLYKQRHDYSTYARFSTDPFEEFFGNHFRTQDQDITLFHKLSVTAKHFENNIMEKSVHTPALVLFYTDWCFDCVRAAAFWRRLVEALQPLGVTVATVHAGHETSLVRRIGVHGVPCLTLVLDQHVYIYKESLNSMPKILGHIVEVSRNELVAAIFRDPSKSLDSKCTNLLEFVKQKLNYPPEYQNKVREKVSTFFSKFKTKYFAVHRRKDLFYKNHADWIGGKETFPSHKPVAGPGRPSSSFDDVGPRSKRRKVEHLVQNATGNELSFAASMSYRKEGQNDKAKVISKVSAASSVELKSCLSSFDSDNGILTADQALCVLLDAQLSVHQYNVIRDADKSRFPSYKKVLAAKKLCYPNENAISASDKHVCIALQDILDHTCIRLAQSISEVLMSINNVTNLKLHIKWGIDGTSGFTEYKQKFQNTSSKDGSMIVTCMVPLRLVGDTEKEKGVVLWQNSRPSSTRFCRPLHLQYEHETADLTRQEMSRVELEISNLRPTIIECGNINYPVSHALYFTMTDGKVCNAVTNTSSAQRCYICKLTSTKFNSIAAARQASVDVESLRFGISILHAWLRMFECLLHIGYKLKVAKWRVTKADDKAKVEETKKNIQQGFKEQLGLIVDRPKPGYGSSNDGNTARRFFENIDISSTITGINKSLIYRFHIILITLSSGLDIDTTKFNIYCLKTAVLFIKLYPWYYMPTTVHKILMHSATVISHALLPIGLLSEEAQEARNKDLKSYREFHSRKCSRESTIRDVFNRLLVTSDPYISSCRKLPVKQTKSLPIEVTKMLKPYNYQKATSTAIDSDSNESDLTD